MLQAFKQFQNRFGETLSHIGRGNIRFTKGGPMREIELRLWERPATETTNSVFKVEVLRDGVSIGRISLSRQGLAELIGAYQRQDESTEAMSPPPRGDIDLSAFRNPGRRDY